VDGGLITTHTGAVAPTKDNSARSRIFFSILTAIFCIANLPYLSADDTSVKETKDEEMYMGNDGKFVVGNPKDAATATTRRPTRTAKAAHTKTAKVFDNTDGKSKDNVILGIKELKGESGLIIPYEFWDETETDEVVTKKPVKTTEAKKDDAAAAGPDLWKLMASPFEMIFNTKMKYPVIIGAIFGLIAGLLTSGVVAATGYGALGGLLVGILVWAMHGLNS